VVAVVVVVVVVVAVDSVEEADTRECAVIAGMKSSLVNMEGEFEVALDTLEPGVVTLVAA